MGDNPALQAALNTGEEVIPLFVRDPFFGHSRFYSKKRAATAKKIGLGRKPKAS